MRPLTFASKYLMDELKTRLLAKLDHWRQPSSDKASAGTRLPTGEEKASASSAIRIGREFEEPEILPYAYYCFSQITPDECLLDPSTFRVHLLSVEDVFKISRGRELIRRAIRQSDLNHTDEGHTECKDELISDWYSVRSDFIAINPLPLDRLISTIDDRVATNGERWFRGCRVCREAFCEGARMQIVRVADCIPSFFR